MAHQIVGEAQIGMSQIGVRLLYLNKVDVAFRYLLKDRRELFFHAFHLLTAARILDRMVKPRGSSPSRSG